MEDNYNDRIINDALRTRGYYPLRPMQLWMVDSQFYKTKSTMMNIGALFKLSPKIDLNRFAQAINNTLNNYDIFRCRLVFHPETNDICQRFDGEIIPAKIEKLSDEEFERRKKTLMQPYELFNNPLYRIYLFETPTAKYCYSDFYHAILDGTAIGMLFVKEVDLRYKGKKISRTPVSYADYILEDMKISKEEFDAGSKYWLDILDKFDENKHYFPADLLEGNNEKIATLETDWKSGSIIIPVKNITEKYFLATKKKEFNFFLAATMLAIAKLAGSKSSIMDWVHNGRYTMQELRLMGAMLEQYPICCEFEENMSVENLFKSIDEKVNTGFKYRKSLSTAYNSEKDICPTFAFQKKTLGALNNLILGGYPAEVIEVPENEWSVSENALDVEVNLTDEGTYLIEYSYDASIYSENTIKNFAAAIDEIVLKMQDENILISDIL